MINYLRLEISFAFSSLCTKHLPQDDDVLWGSEHELRAVCLWDSRIGM